MRRVAVLSLLIVVAWVNVAAADGAADRALLRAIYALFSGTGGARASQIVLMDGGLVFDSWDDLTTPEMRVTVSRLLDRLTPRNEWLFRPTGSTVSGIYGDVLGAVWATSSLTAAERQQLTTIATELFSDAAVSKPSPAYQRYLDLSRRRDELRARWEATPEDDRTAVQRTELEEAESDVILIGRETHFQDLLVRRATLLAKSPRRRAADLRARFDTDAATVGGVRLHETTLRGLADGASSGTGWTTIELQFTPPPVAGTTPPLPSDWRMWRIGSGPSAQYLDSQAAVVTVRFEFRAFDVDRPWLASGVLTSRAWKWPAGVTRPLAGAGAADVLPLVPTQALCVRNLTVTGDFSEGELREVLAAMRRADALAWGPFAIAGSYVTSSDRFRARRIAGGFRVDDLQLVALAGEALTPAPNPDPALTWEP